MKRWMVDVAVALVVLAFAVCAWWGYALTARVNILDQELGAAQRVVLPAMRSQSRSFVEELQRQRAPEQPEATAETPPPPPTPEPDGES